jgi:DNA-directed RNA polymerase subunit RPC12/RpoP
MGWYGEHNEECPNCGKENAVTQFHNDLRGPLYLACPDCGLRMMCEETVYLISNTYIDKSIIGKDPLKDPKFENLMDLTETKSEQVINHIYY